MSSARKLRLVPTQTTNEASGSPARTRAPSRVRQAHRYPRAELEEVRVLEAPDYEVVYVERRGPVFEAELIDIEEAREWIEGAAPAPVAKAAVPERKVIRHTLPPRGNTTMTIAPLARTKAARSHDESAMISLPEDRRRMFWGWSVSLCAFVYVAWALIP